MDSELDLLALFGIPINLQIGSMQIEIWLYSKHINGISTVLPHKKSTLSPEWIKFFLLLRLFLARKSDQFIQMYAFSAKTIDNSVNKLSDFSDL